MKKLIFTLLFMAMFSQTAYADTEYKILDQGNVNACTQYAVITCIDVMGEPTKINPITAYKALNEDGYQDMTDTLNYYVSCGAITSYKRITPSAICVDQYLEKKIPVIVVTWQDAKDWRDGDITVPNMIFYGTHASILVEKTKDYYIGVNSWGENWGYNGMYHLYNINILGSAFVIEPKENVIF